MISFLADGGADAPTGSPEDDKTALHSLLGLTVKQEPVDPADHAPDQMPLQTPVEGQGETPRGKFAIDSDTESMDRSDAAELESFLSRRKRIPYTQPQIVELEKHFAESQFCLLPKRLEIATALNLTPRQVRCCFGLNSS